VVIGEVTLSTPFYSKEGGEGRVWEGYIFHKLCQNTDTKSEMIYKVAQLDALPFFVLAVRKPVRSLAHALVFKFV